ncbi:MAG: pectinesterase family protein [Nitrospirales bacterium]
MSGVNIRQVVPYVFVSLVGLVCGMFVPLLAYAEETKLPATPTASVWQVASDGTGHFTLIQEAIEQAASGDTILIKAGTYAEDVTIHSKDRVSIIGDGMDQVYITGEKRVGTLHIGKWPYGATDVTVQGLTVIQHGGLGVGIFNGSGVHLKHIRVKGMVFSQQVQDLHIEDCVIGESETTGVAFADSTGTLSHNLIVQNDHGVAIGGQSTVTLRQNVIANSLFEAVLMTDQSKATLLQNTLVHNGGGVAFHDETQAEVIGNIISHNTVGLLFYPQSHTALTYNALYGNQSDYLLQGTPPTPTPQRAGKTDMALAPGFINLEKGDFRLRADSLLIHIGEFPFLGALPPISSNP